MELCIFRAWLRLRIFCFLGVFCVELNSIRELNAYTKMYNILFNTIEECSRICTDDIVKEKLIDTKKTVEKIYNSEVDELCKRLNPDELTILLLLDTIKAIEIQVDSNVFDLQLLKDSSEWLSRYKLTDYIQGQE